MQTLKHETKLELHL